jgi:hypothetical protein
LHPLLPSTHHTINLDFAVDVYFSYVPPMALDAYLPLQALFARHLVCALVPKTYLLNMPHGRFAWLRQLEVADRIRYGNIHSCPSLCWLFIATTPAVWARAVTTSVLYTTHAPL